MNEVEKIFKAIGHGFVVVFADGKSIGEKIPEYVEVAECALEDAPTIVKDVTDVVTAATGGAALFEALVAAVGGFGGNAAADLAVVTALAADAPKIGTYWVNLKDALTKLLQTLGADEKQIAAIFAVAVAAPATPVVG